MGAYTSEAYWKLLPLHLAVTAGVFLAGRTLMVAIGHGSRLRRAHGQFVFWWSVSGYFVGWFAGPLVGADCPQGLVGASAIFMLSGWLAGTLHGALALAIRHHCGGSR